MDLWLHFDITPWHITHSLFPTPTATLVINVLYNLWFFVKWGVVIFFILYRQDDKLRTQFLVTFLASWLVIGNISATILSSAGPVFMQPLFDVNHYQPLMERLANQNFALLNSNSLPIWALDTQAMLLEHYLQNENSLGSGISAMPSMHVTIATLIAISVSKLNRWGGALAWLYALSIQIGSVHLGWHYAVDGYVGVILTILLWKLVGWLLIRTRLTSDINHHLTN
ncbi:phosphatase PAP2 family protein [Vibrio fortis]|uniref:phosphatase PAP2 family protein n=1 Tax=Vibrio fortis TaxID=212667 RepID=UPI00177F716C|nr:phosphatase PAP2 family protein [Vibrio fortis]